MRPPRPSEESSEATLPMAKDRSRNNGRWNIGSLTCTSMTQKAARRATPPARLPTTIGLVQPIVWPPYGWMP